MPCAASVIPPCALACAWCAKDAPLDSSRPVTPVQLWPRPKWYWERCPASIDRHWRQCSPRPPEKPPSYTLLRQLPLNFAGNVEGRDLYNGNVDVIVCDGFIGNVALKVSEGLVTTVRFLLKESLKSTISSQVGFLLSRRAFDDFKKRLD